VRRLLILIPAAALLAACGGGGNESEGNGEVVQTIQISETEFALNPSSVTLPKAGTYEFEVTNDGKITHALEIEESGGGAEAETGDIDPSAKKTVRFTFSGSGSFEMYCPIDGHEDKGMKGTITVGGAAGGGGGTTTDEGETTTDENPGY
jgi:PQQ system protein